VEKENKELLIWEAREVPKDWDNMSLEDQAKYLRKQYESGNGDWHVLPYTNKRK
jgi:hypothetical protein